MCLNLLFTAPLPLRDKARHRRWMSALAPRLQASPKPLNKRASRSTISRRLCRSNNLSNPPMKRANDLLFIASVHWPRRPIHVSTSPSTTGKTLCGDSLIMELTHLISSTLAAFFEFTSFLFPLVGSAGADRSEIRCPLRCAV